MTLVGIADIAAANRFIADSYLPAHNARFSKPPEIGDSGFVPADPAQLAEILCVEEERVVCRDNIIVFGRLRLQLPESPLPRHYVKTRVKVRQYPDGTLAVFHGPRCVARYHEGGTLHRPVELRTAA